MKKYSASKHHTLNELNITPLLDLAFVMLVIFVITTAPPINDLEIALPNATPSPKEDKPSKVNYVTVDNKGTVYLNAVTMDLDTLLRTLVEFRKSDPDLNVVVRGDANIQYQKIVDVLDVLVSARINKVGLETAPTAAK